VNWSQYQLAVFDRVGRPGNLFVKAVAGSGKTTVIEEYIKRIPFERSVLAMAYNCHIRDELMRRLSPYPNVTVKNLNGFGNGIIKENTGWAKVKDTKTIDVLFFDVLGGAKSEALKSVYYKTRRGVEKIVGLCKNMCIWAPTADDIIGLAMDFDINVPDEVHSWVEMIQKTMELSWQKPKTIDFDDQIAYPLYHKMDIPQFDEVVVDEAQDLSSSQRELCIRASRDKLVFVGDPRQAIYQFRGADEKSVETIIATADCIVLPLSVCYRCSKAVVNGAKKLVPDIEYHPAAKEGIYDRMSEERYRGCVVGGDVILCRCTAPLVQECLRLIREDNKATVKGRDIGEKLLELVDAATGDEGLSVEHFATELHLIVADKIKRHPKNEQEWQDKQDTIECFFSTCQTVADIKRKIISIFEDKQDESGIRLMTVHKSKGLENRRIFLIRPDLLPHPKSRDLEAENNLHYVAITRAKEDFWYVDAPQKR